MNKNFADVFHSLPTNGWLSMEEAALLWRCALEVKGSILEVGSYMGRSTCLLAQSNDDRWVHSVDPFDGFDSDLAGNEVEKQFKANLKERGVHNSLLYRCTAKVFRDWLRSYNNKTIAHYFEMAYLDGDHTPEGTREQIELALDVKAKVIAIHDVNDTGDGKLIKDVAVSILGKWSERVERLAVWRLT